MKQPLPVNVIKRLVALLVKAGERDGVGAELHLVGTWEIDREGGTDVSLSLGGRLPIEIPVDAEAEGAVRREFRQLGDGQFSLRLWVDP